MNNKNSNKNSFQSRYYSFRMLLLAAGLPGLRFQPSIPIPGA